MAQTKRGVTSRPPLFCLILGLGLRFGQING